MPDRPPRNDTAIARTVDPALRRPGRGGRGNAAGRYERLRVEYLSDGWADTADLAQGAASLLRTQVAEERPRRAIAWNRSPDLPFDRAINPYRGCEHGCIYCFARPAHAWLGLSPGLDFETRLTARPDMPRVLAAELRRPGYEVAPLVVGTATDPYQPVERDRGITRACLEVLHAFRHPTAVVTRGRKSAQTSLNATELLAA